MAHKGGSERQIELRETIGFLIHTTGTPKNNSLTYMEHTFFSQ